MALSPILHLQPSSISNVNQTARFSARLAASALALVVIAGCNHPDAPAPASTAPTSVPTAQAPAPEKKAGFTLVAEGLPQPDGTKVVLNGLARGADGKWAYGDLGHATVQGGKFSLSGSVELPVPGTLQIGEFHGKDFAYVNLILENMGYQVRDTDGVLTAKGGRYNDLVYGYASLPAYVAAVEAKDKAEAVAFKGIAANDDKAMLAAKIAVAPTMAPYYAAINKIMGDYLAKVIDGPGDDLSKFYALSADPDNVRYPPARRDAMMAAFAGTLADNPAYQQAKAAGAEEVQARAASSAMALGKPYRDISVVDKDGHTVKLSDVLKKNKFVLLDFWASWCAPCRAEFPYLAKVYHDYHAAGFEIYGVSLDEERGDWLKAMQQESANGHLPWINLRAEGFGSQAAAAYGVRGLPNNFLIDSDGRIVGKDMRGNDVEKVVAAQLKKLGKG